MARAVLNRRTGRFILMADSAGNEFCGRAAAINARPFHAMATPSAAPVSGEHERFGEQLGDDARAIGSYGGADGDFVLALRAAREKEDGDVCAAYHEEETDGCEEKIEHGAEWFGESVRDAAQADAKALRIVAGLLSRIVRSMAGVRRWLGQR